MAGGRPTSYKPEYCELLIQHGKEGGSVFSFCKKTAIRTATFYNLVKNHAEFALAYERYLKVCPTSTRSIKQGPDIPTWKTRAYSSWAQMKYRCNNEKSPDFKRYGGRGIKVCEEWNDFSQFVKDMGDPPSHGHSIDRINNNLGYSKDNCRWADKYQQAKNRRPYVGRSSK